MPRTVVLVNTGDSHSIKVLASLSKGLDIVERSFVFVNIAVLEASIHARYTYRDVYSSVRECCDNRSFLRTPTMCSRMEAALTEAFDFRGCSPSWD